MVVSADAVYTMDYAALIDEHVEAGADVTMVTTEVDPGDADRYGVVQAAGGRISEYVYKPDRPGGNLICNEVFAFRPDALLDTLEELAAAAGDEGLEDLGHALLPQLVEAGSAHEHRFEGYWRDVGTIPAYWSAHQELLADEAPIDLDDPSWPVLTRASAAHAPSRIAAGACVEASLLAPGARVAGTVSSSVIGRGAIVEAGAVVSESVILPGAVVRAGARVTRAIIDDGVIVSPEATVGAAGGDIALVGLRATVEAGSDVPAGGRFPAEDS